VFTLHEMSEHLHFCTKKGKAKQMQTRKKDLTQSTQCLPR